MVLIQCPGCKKEVSDEVLACPFCGKPRSHTKKLVVTIEQTSKEWKLLQLLSIFIIIAALISVHWIGPKGFLLCLFGIFIYIIGRLGAWWNNG